MGEKLHENSQEMTNNNYDTSIYARRVYGKNPRSMGKKSAKQFQYDTWWLYKAALHTARPHTFGGFRETPPPTP